MLHITYPQWKEFHGICVNLVFWWGFQEHIWPFLKYNISKDLYLEKPSLQFKGLLQCNGSINFCYNKMWKYLCREGKMVYEKFVIEI